MAETQAIGALSWQSMSEKMQEQQTLLISGFAVWFLINIGCLLAIGVVVMRAAVGRVFAIEDLAGHVIKYMYTSFLVSWAIGWLLVYTRNEANAKDFKYIIGTLIFRILVSLSLLAVILVLSSYASMML